VNRQKIVKREKGYFTAKELQALFGPRGPWQDDQERACFTLAAFCGMRRSEILALSWGDVDFSEHVIRVTRAWKTEKGDALGPPKSGTPRTVALPHDRRTGATTLGDPASFGLSAGWTGWQKAFGPMVDLAFRFRHATGWRGLQGPEHYAAQSEAFASRPAAR
jgi:hypothetical protein